MTTKSANELLDRLQSDHDFAVEVHRLAADPTALQGYLGRAGFEVTGDDVVTAFVERYGDRLSPEQLDAVSGGVGAIVSILIIAVPAILAAIAGVGGGAVGGIAIHNATH